MRNIISKSAKIYADSLIKLDLDNNIIQNDLNTVIEVTDNSKDLRELLENPCLPKNIKYSVLEEIFSGVLNNNIVNFLKILTEKNRFCELKSIKCAFEESLDLLNNKQKADVISAVELSQTQKNKILEKLNNRLKKEVIPRWIIDKNIIGGLMIKINDNIIDMSVKNKLKQLSEI